MARTWSRINTVLLVLTLLAVLSLIAMYATGASGGPLDPPSAPASTDAVRLPGTPISSAPYTISAPGRYYLTRNLTVPAQQIAITIAADDVSLDLGGFTIADDIGNKSNSWGVRLSGTRQNVTIANGTVRFFQFGFDSSDPNNRTIVLRDVSAVNDIRGFSLTGFNVVLTDCTANDNTETGIYFPVDRGIVRNCNVRNNDGDGISVVGNRNLIEGNAVTHNDVIDIHVAGGSFHVVRDNIAGLITLAGNNNNVVMDNQCIVLSGAGATDIIAATSHQNVGC
jgi:hypothetical protein